jgi:hypothetical protein
MRVVEKRVRRLEVGLLPAAETPEDRRLHEIDILRRRAARHGLPEPEDVPAPSFRPGMSMAEMIIAARVRRPLPEAAGTFGGANGRALP